MKKVIILLSILMMFCGSLSSSELNKKKWDKLSDNAKWEMVTQLYNITRQMESQRNTYQNLLENELRLTKKLKPKTGGLSVGMDAGFRYDNLTGTFKPTMGVIVNGHLVVFNSFMLSPGINVNFYKDPGLKIILTFGYLF